MIVRARAEDVLVFATDTSEFTHIATSRQNLINPVQELRESGASHSDLRNIDRLNSSTCFIRLRGLRTQSIIGSW